MPQVSTAIASNMQEKFDLLSLEMSKMTTKSYSTSFSLGISLLSRHLHDAIYSIYGFVRFADEIVDSMYGFDRTVLLSNFKEETWVAIEKKISYHPILQSFQKTVHKYGIDRELIDAFFQSMEMDLKMQQHNQRSYENYIYGSAEVVGLMCLHVFVQGDMDLYRRLEPSGRALGSAFQKVNFLRDLSYDNKVLGRSYFPGWEEGNHKKSEVEDEIAGEFRLALQGIRQLPRSSRLGVYTAYRFYKCLFTKLKARNSHEILKERVRVPNTQKLILAFKCWVRVGLSKLN